MRVVFDSNVLVSAFLWKRRLKPIYSAVRNGRVQLCFTPETWAELQRVLHCPKLARQLEKISIVPHELSRLITSRARFSVSHKQVSVIEDDVSDNALLSAALATKARVLVSGDKHLLHLKAFQGIPILSPAQFIQRHLSSS